MMLMPTSVMSTHMQTGGILWARQPIRISLLSNMLFFYCAVIQKGQSHDDHVRKNMTAVFDFTCNSTVPLIIILKSNLNEIACFLFC